MMDSGASLACRKWASGSTGHFSGTKPRLRSLLILSVFCGPALGCGGVLAAKGSTSSIWDDHVRSIKAAGVSPAQAVERAKTLEKKVVAMVSRFTGAIDRRRVLRELMEETDDGDLVAGTGYSLTTGSPKRGANPYPDWARTEAEIGAYSDLMAASTGLRPGEIRYPPHEQVGRDGTETVIDWRPFGPRDGNALGLYEEIVQLRWEELLHVVQNLRRYAGVPWHLSRYTRDEHDDEADVFAMMTLDLGLKLRPCWRRRYESRAAIDGLRGSG